MYNLIKGIALITFLVTAITLAWPVTEDKPETKRLTYSEWTNTKL